MQNDPKLKEILTLEELAEVNGLRCELLKSVSSMERNYYTEEINSILRSARERYFKRKSYRGKAKEA